MAIGLLMICLNNKVPSGSPFKGFEFCPTQRWLTVGGWTELCKGIQNTRNPDQQNSHESQASVFLPVIGNCN